MKMAMNGIEELMFYDTYQRYPKQFDDEAGRNHAGHDLESTAPLTEMTNPAHKQDS